MSYDNKYDRPEGAGLRTINDPQQWEAGIPQQNSGMDFYLTLRHKPNAEITQLAESHSMYTSETYDINTALLADLAHAFLVHIKDRRVKVI